MNKDAVDFFADMGLHISKISAKSPIDISRGQIEEACEKFYHKWQDGFRCKPVEIVKGHIFPMARKIVGKKQQDNNAGIEALKKNIKRERIIVFILSTISSFGSYIVGRFLG